jgi:Ser-tRNA(Ala) deacylase AlaX
MRKKSPIILAALSFLFWTNRSSAESIVLRGVDTVVINGGHVDAKKTEKKPRHIAKKRSTYHPKASRAGVSANKKTKDNRFFLQNQSIKIFVDSNSHQLNEARRSSELNNIMIQARCGTEVSDIRVIEDRIIKDLKSVGKSNDEIETYMLNWRLVNCK